MDLEGFELISMDWKKNEQILFELHGLGWIGSRPGPAKGSRPLQVPPNTYIEIPSNPGEVFLLNTQTCLCLTVIRGNMLSCSTRVPVSLLKTNTCFRVPRKDMPCCSARRHVLLSQGQIFVLVLLHQEDMWPCSTKLHAYCFFNQICFCPV
jgi:hypothetical protein